jgi:hypothetical protein
MAVYPLHTTLLRELVALISASMLFTGCAKTFLVSKDCNTYLFGSQDQTLYRMLCTSGDLEAVLTDAGLPADAQAGLLEAQCTYRSKEKADRIYGSLTSKQQDALKSAFREHGYEINAKPAPNFRVYPDYDNVNFCPPEPGKTY